MDGGVICRRLVYMLLEEQRYDVAMEIVTKFHLDPSTVHASWGLNMLRCGDYRGAREKLARSLRKPADMNSTNKQQLLASILRVLAKAPKAGTPEVRQHSEERAASKPYSFVNKNRFKLRLG